MVVYTRRKPLIDKALSSVDERDAKTTRRLQALVIAEPTLNANPFIFLPCKAQKQFIAQKGSQRKQIV